MGTRTPQRTSSRPARLMRALAAVIVLGATVVMASGPVAAQDDDTDPTLNEVGDAGFVDVIEVNGLIDPVLADFIEDSLDNSRRNGARAVVLQMESEGVAISDERLAELADTVAGFDVPVSVWLGPAGKGRALGGAGQLAVATTRIGVSPGSRIGDFGPRISVGAAANTPLARMLDGGFSGSVVDYDELLALAVDVPGVQVQDAPALLNHLLELPEFDFQVYNPGEQVPNGPIVGDEPIRGPLTATRFLTLPLIDQQFHTFASPAVAYLLFVIGLGLLVFELYTAGVGVAGVIGAGSFLGASYGLAVLDARPVAVGLLVLAFIGFAIDVQSGIQQFWSAVGSLSLIVGSIFLFPEHGVGWLPLLVGIVGVLLAMLGGMPAMVRTRFSTPTIGRAWMIGEIGNALDDIDPEGVVTLRGAPWRARTNRATPILAGHGARVVEVDGLLLEVEPIEGGAIDYREKRRSADA
ncbi:MAG: NfeD family protein [Acidimicrobiales bacterium]